MFVCLSSLLEATTLSRGSGTTGSNAGELAGILTSPLFNDIIANPLEH